MKKVITAILILVAFTTQAQDSAYNSTVKFNMTDSIENGITFQRKANWEAVIYNQRVNSVALQFSIDFYSTDGTKKMKAVKGYSREVIVGTSNYVVSSTGAWVGDKQQMLALYGTLRVPGIVDSGYVKLPGSQYYQLSTPCMTEYDYFAKVFDNTNKMSAYVKSIGQREAAAGKLN